MAWIGGLITLLLFCIGIASVSSSPEARLNLNENTLSGLGNPCVVSSSNLPLVVLVFIVIDALWKAVALLIFYLQGRRAFHEGNVMVYDYAARNLDASISGVDPAPMGTHRPVGVETRSPVRQGQPPAFRQPVL